MVIFFSNKITSKQKEIISNAIFEIQEGMPRLIDAFQPIYTLLGIDSNTGGLSAKTHGCNILTPKNMLEESVMQSITSESKEKGESFLLKNSISAYLNNQLRSTSSGLLLVNNATKDSFLSISKPHSSLYYIGPEDDDQFKGFRWIPMKEFCEYEIIRLELKSFFELISNEKPTLLESVDVEDEVNKNDRKLLVEPTSVYSSLKQIREVIKSKKDKQEQVISVEDAPEKVKSINDAFNKVTLEEMHGFLRDMANRFGEVPQDPLAA